MPGKISSLNPLNKDFLSSDTFGENNYTSKAYIPLNVRSHFENTDYTINENSAPCKPYNPSLPLKYAETSKLHSDESRYKFAYLKIKLVCDKSTGKYHRECQSTAPLTFSPCRRMLYVYLGNYLRAYPDVIWGTDVWSNTYKMRLVVERYINHVKEIPVLPADVHRIKNIVCKPNACKHYTANNRSA